MSIFDKTRYIRTLFILLPLGLAFFYWGIKGLNRSIEHLPYTQGIVEKHKKRLMYFESCECDVETFLIYVKGIKPPFVTSIKKYREILDSVVSVGDSIEIWTEDFKSENQIEQVKLNGQLVIPYNKTTDLYIGLSVIGVGLIILCIFYIIKSPEDLFGKKKA